MTHKNLIAQYPALKSVLDEQDYLLHIRRRSADGETLEAQLRACEILEETLPGMVPSDKAAIMVAAVVELSPVNPVAFDTDKYSSGATSLLAERNEEFICRVDDRPFSGPPSRDLSRAVTAAATARVEYLGMEAIGKGIEHLGVAPSQVEGRVMTLFHDLDRYTTQLDAPKLYTAWRKTIGGLIDTVRGRTPGSSGPKLS